jgi:hypothetical protein
MFPTIQLYWIMNRESSKMVFTEGWNINTPRAS